ncbi:hypothetical protein AYL99_11977 [Fonsecaea erecta]|uniref:Uncharacterized protein n=1 Tax=Fonsecaea erecta TaxID=1367422 RepID=A0A178Z1Y3_9EURO|nr:hypothetical protein AYL99_11977 [Fonsecaea erecta]OAP53820.1 hypothetical protein AYL99_11977 [Fonsecaea erecta]
MFNLMNSMILSAGRPQETSEMTTGSLSYIAGALAQASVRAQVSLPVHGWENGRTQMIQDISLVLSQREESWPIAEFRDLKSRIRSDGDVANSAVPGCNFLLFGGVLSWSSPFSGRDLVSAQKYGLVKYKEY